jgi:hypothetical protein
MGENSEDVVEGCKRQVFLWCRNIAKNKLEHWILKRFHMDG